MTYMNNGLKVIGDQKAEAIFEEPLIFTSFVTSCKGHEPTLIAIEGMDDLKRVLEEKLEEYNEAIAQMDLVLFD